jgi:hypothetical protein
MKNRLLYDDPLAFLNKKYSTVTPIETEISGLLVIGTYSVN